MDRSRAPKQVHHRTPDEIEKLITAERRKHPTWGPKKIHVPVQTRGRPDTQYVLAAELKLYLVSKLNLYRFLPDFSGFATLLS